ncbi:MAG TPA: hypothetical protein PLP39_09780 [Flavobacterium lutivivi]|nr:hypothetical protein [Flavobacterium lutivivi]
MKNLILITSLFILTCSVYGQTKKRPKEKITIDTISVKNDSLLAKILTFVDDSLQEENTAYLLPDSFQIPRFRFLKQHFIRTIYVSRIFRHGKTIKYLTNGNKKVSTYKYGKEINIVFLDKNNSSITKELAYDNKIIIGPCGILKEEIIFEGKKKK